MATTSNSNVNEDEIRHVEPIALPGTERLYDFRPGNVEEAAFLSSLQHVKKGDGHILLVPQPSITDPNDPLLWSTTKKTLTLVNGLAYSFLGAVTGPIMAAGMG